MFNWKQFINLADELFQNSNFQNKEALYRTIIIIAYYGIFKQVQDCLKRLEEKKLISLPEEDKDKKKLGLHDKFIYFLSYHNNADIKTFGGKLFSLKRERIKANYKLNINIDEKKSKEVLTQAKKLNDDWNNKVKHTLISSLNIQKHSPPPC